MNGHVEIKEQKQKEPLVINASSPIEQQIDHYRDASLRNTKLWDKKKMLPGSSAWLRKALKSTRHLNSEMRELVHIPTLAVYSAEYGKRFNEKVEAQTRLEKMENHKSALYQKKKNAIMVREAVNSNSRRCLDSMEKAMLGREIVCEDGNLYKDLAMFMGAGEQELSAQDKRKLLDHALGTSRNADTGQIEGQNIKAALGLMSKSLFALDIPSLRLDSDVLMAGNAEKLEAITGQVAAYEHMLERYPGDYFREIDDDIAGMLKDHLNKLRLIAAYYVSRKEVVTDMEYSTFYDEELTLELDDTASDEQKAMVEKIMNSTVLAAKLMEVSGVRQKDRKGVVKAVKGVKSNASKRILAKAQNLINEKQQRELLERSVKKMSYFGVNGFGAYTLNAKNCGASFGSLFKGFNDLEDHGNFFGTNSVEMKLVKKHMNELRKITSASAFKLGFYEFKYQMAQTLQNLKEACKNYRKYHEDRNDLTERYNCVVGIQESAENCFTFVGSLDQEKYQSLIKDNEKLPLSVLLRNSGVMLEKDDTEMAKTDQMLLRKQFVSLSDDFYSYFSDTSAFFGNKQTLDLLEKKLKTKVGSDEDSFTRFKNGLIRIYEIVQQRCKNYLNNNDPAFSSGLNKVDICTRTNENAARMIAYLNTITFADRNKLVRGSGTWKEMLFGHDIIKMREVGTGQDKRIESEDGEIGVSFLESKEDIKENSYKNIIELAGGDISMLREYREAQLRKKNGGVKTGLAYKSYIDERVNGHDHGLMQYKSSKEIIDAANENNLNIVYSDVALRQLTTIRIMDTLFGKKKRRLDTIKYNARTQVLAGEPVIYIKMVFNTSNDGFFGKQDNKLPEGEDEGIETSVLDENGDLNIEAYDRTVADKIMGLAPETFFESFTENGIELSEQEKEAFTLRLTALQNAFRKDMTEEGGWRKERDIKDEEQRLEDIKTEEDNLTRYIRWGKAEDHPLVVSTKDRLAELQQKKIRDGNGTYRRSLMRQIKAKKSLGLVEKEFIGSIKTLKEEQQVGQEQIEEEKKDVIISPRQQIRIQKAKDKIKEIKQSRSNFTCISDKIKMKKKGEFQRDVEKMQKSIDSGKYKVSEDFKEMLRIFREYSRMDVRVNRSLTIAAQEAGFNNADFLKEGELMLKGLALAEKELAKIPKDTKDKNLISQKNVLERFKINVRGLKDGNLEVPENTVPVVVSDDAFKICETDMVNLKITEKKDHEWRDMSKYPLFSHEPSANDIAQGYVGDCYALSTIAAIVDTNPQVIKKMMKDNGDTVTVKFCTDNGDKYVTVKKTIPKDTHEGGNTERDYYVRGALWIQMLEKALVASGLIKDLYRADNTILKDTLKDKSDIIAMLEQEGQVSYDLISGGSSEYFVRFITGNRGKKTVFDEEPDEEYSGQLSKSKIKYTEEQQRFLNEAEELNKGYVKYSLVASTKENFDFIEGSGISPESDTMGVYNRHAYAVIGTRDIQGEKTIVLRNPWGIGTNEAAYNEKTGAVTQQITFEEENQGFVFMPVDIFFRLFSSYTKNEL